MAMNMAESPKKMRLHVKALLSGNISCNTPASHTSTPCPKSSANLKNTEVMPPKERRMGSGAFIRK